MKIYLMTFLLFSVLLTNAQTVRFNGVYESKGDSSISYYLRFYADGSISQTTTESDSKEVIKKWFNYENRRSHCNGFYFIEKNLLFISATDPYVKKTFLEKGEIKNGGDIIELTSFHYSDGMVTKFSYGNQFVFKAFK